MLFILISINVALCILIISLFHPQIMDGMTQPGISIVGSSSYVSKPWHNAGGARYFMHKGQTIPSYQEMVAYIGFPYEATYVDDHGGVVPQIDENNKENFWYDMNRLEDTGWESKTLDKEFKDMLYQENQWHKNLIRKKQLASKKSTNFHQPIEGFGNNRAPNYWNEVDYPIVTSNGLNMTPRFPQNATVPKISPIMLGKLWGDYRPA